MRRRHFETLRPICPRGAVQGASHPLKLGEAFVEEGEHIVQGVIRCTETTCRLEFPILDGVPFLVADVRAFVTQQAAQLLQREDLHPFLDSLVGDCCGPGSVFDTTRQHLSSYVWDHYADLDPAEPAGEAVPGAILAVLERGLELAGAPPAGPVLDAGCGVGRTSYALAERFPDALVLGIDLNVAMLRLAARALRTGRLRYPRRRVGLVYDWREFPLELPGRERVDFWACDGAVLPFAPGGFALANSLNLLDCLHSPLDHLVALERVLAPGGRALIASPYDWAPQATPVEGWIGGHSQRGDHAGQSSSVLRALLTPGGHPGSLPHLRVRAEEAELPWQVRLHDRCVTRYSVHLAVAERAEEQP